MNGVIPPGATIGVLGSGQLGRMLALAAHQLSYRVITFSPERDSPTGQVAEQEWVNNYDDLDAVRAFARAVDVVTFEFENVPAATAAAAAECAPVRPDGRILHVSQQRLREKRFLTTAGFPVAGFRAVTSLDELNQGLADLGVPAVLKSASFGYDGKGQQRIDEPGQASAAWQAVDSQVCILEQFVRFERELSVVSVRALDGATVEYGPIENRHSRHILDLSIAPPELDPRLAAEARTLARAVSESLEVVGVLCVELFLTEQGGLLVNELAPRPHNSGHYTIDACETSQFEQQLRAVCGLPLGSTHQPRPAAMANLLGELWSSGEPNWPAALGLPGVRLHLYGKSEPRPGRKMGHLTAIAETSGEATRLALTARDALRR